MGLVLVWLYLAGTWGQDLKVWRWVYWRLYRIEYFIKENHMETPIENQNEQVEQAVELHTTAQDEAVVIEQPTEGEQAQVV